MLTKTTKKFGKWKLTVDDRTETMPLNALLCRSMNHPWQRIPLGPTRRAELLKLGQTEFHWVCIRCQSRRIDLFELPSFATLTSKIEYSDDYLVKDKGTGRLPRSEARLAMFVRDDGELV
jgi:hypothetical protein